MLQPRSVLIPYGLLDLPAITSLGVSACIVSRGDWLGNPANFKGAVCCLACEVETYHHVTMTLHRLTSVQNNMVDLNDLFFFGDNFDAVLDILEIGEELEEQFTEAVDEVSMRKLFSTLYKPKVWL